MKIEPKAWKGHTVPIVFTHKRLQTVDAASVYANAIELSLPLGVRKQMRWHFTCVKKIFRHTQERDVKHYWLLRLAGYF